MNSIPVYCLRLYSILFITYDRLTTCFKQFFSPFLKPYLPSSSLTKACFCHNTVQSGFWFLHATFFHWWESTLIWLVVNVGGRIPKVSGKSPTSFPKIIFGDNHKRRRKFGGSQCAITQLARVFMALFRASSEYSLSSIVIFMHLQKRFCPIVCNKLLCLNLRIKRLILSSLSIIMKD